MQKIEKWRIQELTQVLNQLAALLREGNNREWASVFNHFAQEAHALVQSAHFDSEGLQRLMKNMRTCFEGASTLHSLVLSEDNSKRMEELHQEFTRVKGLLFLLLSDIEKKWIEPIN
jgi:hypothetical protein